MVEHITKYCKLCSKEYTTIYKNKVFCSQTCKCSYFAIIEKIRYKEYGYGEGVCLVCNKKYKKTRKVQRYCSIVCANSIRKIYLNIPDCLDRADRKIDKNIGYVRVYCPMHREANTRGYVYEHRVIAEEMLGRDLLPDEVVHHKNGIRWDNRPENLEVMDKYKHGALSTRVYSQKKKISESY